MRKNMTPIVFIQACLCILLSLLFSCSSSSGGGSHDKSETGSIAFSLQAPDGFSGSSSTKAVSGGSVRSEAILDCDGLGIVSVEAYVYNENEELIAQGGPWDCNAGEGIIYGVNEGTNRTVLIFLKNGNNQAVYSGQKSALTIVAGQTTDAGIIVVLEAEDKNQLPIASNDRATVNRGGTVTILDSGLTSVLANDIDPDGQSLTVSTSPVNGPGHGTLTLRPDGTFFYQHNGSDLTSDSFVYRVSDGNGGTATATVTITVIPGPNPVPTLSDGSVSPDRGDITTEYTYSVHYGDPDGNPPEFVKVSIDGVDHSMALFSPSQGIYRYSTHLTSREHTYSFSCNDGHGGSAVFPTSGLRTGPRVFSENPYPIASDDEVEVYKGGRVSVLVSGSASLLSNDVAPTGFELKVDTQAYVEPDHGTPTLLPNGTFSYQHDGSDSASDRFVYRVNDGIGGEDTATVNITVIPGENHNPILSEGSVSHRSGDTTTIFTYAVHYFDEDGHRPASIIVFIDDSPHAMEFAEGLPHDGIYRYRADAHLSTGSHTYSFECSDGYEGSGRYPDSGSLSGPEVYGAVRYYIAPPPLGNDMNDGSLSSPFGSIGRALEIARGTRYEPAVICIAAGTYFENISLDPFESLQGGWSQDFSLRWNFSSDGLFPSTGHETVIEAKETGRGITINSAEGVSIDGLTVRGETLTGTYVSNNKVGGIAIISCSPDITNCRIENNSVPGGADTYGAGMFVSQGSPLIRHCIFSGNYAGYSQNGYGGGMYNLSSSPVIIDCIFTGNYAGGITGAGGAMYNMQSSPTIRNCFFTANVAGGSYALGGAIYNNGGSPVITNSIFTKNCAYGTSYGKGGAIYNQSGNPKVINCSFTVNTAYSESNYSKAGAIYNDTPAAPVIANCILWNNSATYYKELYCGSSCSITYSDVDQAEFASDTCGKIFRKDPLFVDPANSDLRLRSGSPCIDKGSVNVSPLPETDYAGNSRIQGLSVDMGAFEWWLEE